MSTRMFPPELLLLLTIMMKILDVWIASYLYVLVRCKQMAWVDEAEPEEQTTSFFFSLQQMISRGIFLNLSEVTADVLPEVVLFVLKQSWCASVINQHPYQRCCSALHNVRVCRISVALYFQSFLWGVSVGFGIGFIGFWEWRPPRLKEFPVTSPYTSLTNLIASNV